MTDGQTGRTAATEIHPCQSLVGEVFLPGDKSISHRTAMLAALAHGESCIRNYSGSADCRSTLDCLSSLGTVISRGSEQLLIEGGGPDALEEFPGTLDCGNSGTSMRLLAGLLSGLPFRSRLSGDHSLNGRPMARIIAPLTRMGANIRARDNGFPPLEILGGPLHGIEYELPVASAQVKSCVLLAGLLARGETTVVEPLPTRDHTERLIPVFGGEIRKKAHRIELPGGQGLKGASVRIPGDISAASFFLVAASLIPGSSIHLAGVGLNPTRDALLQLLIRHGGRISITNRQLSAGEPVGDLEVGYSPELLERFPARIEGAQIPLLIDEIPILAVLGVHLKKGLEVRDARELRAKESDRIQGIVENLRFLGVESAEREDGFHIAAGQRIGGGTVSTRGDHRLAMAFAVAGLLAEETVLLDDSSCCDVSFPGFFDQLVAVSR